MGFTRIYDYVAGKKDWGSYGLPHEGTNVPERSAGDVAHRDVPTCTLDENLSDVRERVRAAGWDTCIVVNPHGVVLGRIGRTALAADNDASVEQAMTPGPSTVRPSIGADALLERIRERKHKLRRHNTGWSPGRPCPPQGSRINPLTLFRSKRELAFSEARSSLLITDVSERALRVPIVRFGPSD